MYQTEFLLKEYQFKHYKLDKVELLTGTAKAYPVIVGLNPSANEYFLRLGMERQYEILEADEMKDFIQKLNHTYDAEKVEYTPTTRSTFFEVKGQIPAKQAEFEKLMTSLLTELPLKFEELSLMETDFMSELVEETIDLYAYDNSYYLLNNSNYQKILNKQAKYTEREESPITGLYSGILGAILGGSLGTLVAFLMWGPSIHYSFYGWLPSFFSVVMGFACYRKQKGHVSKATYLKLATVVVLIILMLNYGFYTILMGDSRYFFSTLIRLPIILRLSGVLPVFLTNNATAIAIVFIYTWLHYNYHHRRKHLFNIRRIAHQ